MIFQYDREPVLIQWILISFEAILETHIYLLPLLLCEIFPSVFRLRDIYISNVTLSFTISFFIAKMCSFYGQLLCTKLSI